MCKVSKQIIDLFSSYRETVVDRQTDGHAYFRRVSHTSPLRVAGNEKVIINTILQVEVLLFPNSNKTAQISLYLYKQTTTTVSAFFAFNNVFLRHFLVVVCCQNLQLNHGKIRTWVSFYGSILHLMECFLVVAVNFPYITIETKTNDKDYKLNIPIN